MKRIILSIMAAGIAAAGLKAQKTIMDANAEKRTVGSFHGVQVATGIRLMLSEGATEGVAVSAATTEFRDKIITRVENGILKIYYESKLGAINTRKEKKDLKAYVSYKTLDELGANTGAEVMIEGILKSPSVKMNANTGATIKGAININELNVDQNTGSEIVLTGEAGKIAVDGDTGSMFRGIDLKTESCNVTASTGAGVYIMVSKELYVKANTGGYVKYKGEASIRELKTSSGGSISKI